MLDVAYVGSNTHHNHAELGLQRAPRRSPLPALEPRYDRSRHCRPVPARCRITSCGRSRASAASRISGPGTTDGTIRCRSQPTAASPTASSSPAPTPGPAAPPTAGSRTIRCLRSWPASATPRPEGGRGIHLHLGYPTASQADPGHSRQAGLRWLAVPGRLDIRHRPDLEHQRGDRRQLRFHRRRRKLRHVRADRQRRSARAISAASITGSTPRCSSAPRGRGDIGNNCNNAKFILPGFNNHDLSLFKTFKIAERKTLQFRWETFNTFNHTQFSTIGTTAQWSATGAADQHHLRQGTAARDGRKMIFGLKFQF